MTGGANESGRRDLAEWWITVVNFETDEAARGDQAALTPSQIKQANHKRKILLSCCDIVAEAAGETEGGLESYSPPPP